ncbi:MAG: hypothetical protein ACHQ53_17640, partial [Polyangiales bacterium]
AATNVTNSDKTVGWLAAALRAGVLVPAQGPVSVRLSVDALGNLLRPNLEIRGAQPRSSTVRPFGVAGSLDLLIALP